MPHYFGLLCLKRANYSSLFGATFSPAVSNLPKSMIQNLMAYALVSQCRSDGQMSCGR